MRKRNCLIGLLLALCCLCVSVLAAAEGYPEVRLDPRTGRPYDFGGQTIYLYDYWSGSSSELSDYGIWLQDTYNCRIVQQAKGSWGSIVDELISFCQNPDGTLCLFTLPPDFLGKAIVNGACANWKSSASFNPASANWNSAILSLTSIGKGIYGVSAGASEPRQCLFFNKRVLEEVGIDWNQIYDMQQNGTWTWTAFEDLLRRVHRDTDGDGQPDICGLTGSADDLYRVAVFSNNGAFFSRTDSGEIQPAADSENTRGALNWAKQIWKNYSYKRPEGASWDYYKDVWLQGNCGFYIYQTYGGFNENSEMSGLQDGWGCVAFPKGPLGDRYVSVISENITVIPSVYNRHTMEMLTMFYELWTQPTPGEEEDILASKLDYADERAVYETYAMLRDPEHSVTDLALLLGSINDLEGVPVLWRMDEDEVDTLIQGGMPKWNELCDEANRSVPVSLDLTGYKTIFLPPDVKMVEKEAFMETDAEVVVLSDACREIQSGAFASCPNLKYVVVPYGVKVLIAEDAFSDPAPQIIRQ